jgi:hypothetical protein
MARSKRKQAAAKFRRAIRKSNELHGEYLGDADLLESYDRFTRWQLDYMLSFFDDLVAAEGYTDAVDFIVSDLAGTGISERDREIERAAGAIVTTLPAHPLETAAAAVELNAQSLGINLAIWRALHVDDDLPAEITEKAYVMACRSASSYEECMNLVYLAGELGQTLKTLVHLPLIGGLLRTMRAPAHATGFGALQDFLETGFVTFRRIPDIDRFLEQLVARMDLIFQRIYRNPITEFEQA